MRVPLVTLALSTARGINEATSFVRSAIARELGSGGISSGKPSKARAVIVGPPRAGRCLSAPSAP